MANIKITFVQGLQGPAGPAGTPDLSSLPQHKDDAAAILAGMSVGQHYVVAAESDTLVPGTLKRIMST